MKRPRPPLLADWTAARGFPILAFPELNPGTVHEWAQVANFQRLHAAFVHRQKAALQVEHLDAILAAVDKAALKLLALPQRLFRLFPLRDVDEGYDRTEESTVPNHRMGPKLYRKAGAVLSPINLIVSMDALSFLKTDVNGTLVDWVRRAVRPSVVLQRMHVFPEQFGWIVVPEHAHGCTITEKTDTLGIAAKNRLSCGIEYEADEFLAIP